MEFADKFRVCNDSERRASDPIARRTGVARAKCGPVVLLYHSVEKSGGTPDWPWSVSFQRLMEQLDYLDDAGWSPIALGALDRPQIRKASRCFVITFDDAYEDNLPAYEVLAKRGWPATWFVVSNAIGGIMTWRNPGTPRKPTMQPHHLREMRANGMEIGGHSHSHRHLAEIPRSELADETAGCRKTLEDVLGESVDSFSYPHGSYNRAVIEAVRDASYRHACSVDNGFAFQDDDPFRLRRITVRAGDTCHAFARKLNHPDAFARLRSGVRSARSTLRFVRRVTGMDRPVSPEGSPFRIR